ncbi:hypothetical protein QQ045_014776 [Rhodiola kirilowii]
MSETTFSVNCESCGFTEDCTPEYIAGVREMHQGRWICGLCAEAVKDEVRRSAETISTEEALNRCIGYCKEFRTPATVDHISAIGKILRKNLDSPRAARSKSSRVMAGR